MEGEGLRQRRRSRTPSHPWVVVVEREVPVEPVDGLGALASHGMGQRGERQIAWRAVPEWQ